MRCFCALARVSESNDAKPVLCSRCGFLAVNINRSKVFCSFLWVGKNIFDK